MKFTKVQGTGNDFILIEAENFDVNWEQLAIKMCDRHFGIGGDGLLLLLPSDIANFRMRIINSDGSEAEMCGNGVRCIARYIIEKGMINISVDDISLETGAGIKRVNLIKTGNEVIGFRVGMGIPEFRADSIPVIADMEQGDVLDIIPVVNYKVNINNQDIHLSFVSMGNPHAVYFIEQIVSEYPLSEFGPLVERHDMFPNRINFEVARIIDSGRIEARVWERGAGETLACGTGACAIAVAAQKLGLAGDKVDISLPGGLLSIEWYGQGEIYLSGTAELVFDGEWPE